jgi:outer membrane biosynthesis protein TonB
MNTQAIVGAIIAATMGVGAATVATNVQLLSAPAGNSIEQASEVLVDETTILDSDPANVVGPAPEETVDISLTPAESVVETPTVTPETPITPVPEPTPAPIPEPVVQESPAPTPKPAASPAAPEDGDDHEDDDHEDDHSSDDD